MNNVEIIKEVILENVTPTGVFHLHDLSKFFKWENVDDALNQLMAEGKIIVRNKNNLAPWQALVEHPDKQKNLTAGSD